MMSYSIFNWHTNLLFVLIFGIDLPRIINILRNIFTLQMLNNSLLMRIETEMIVDNLRLNLKEIWKKRLNLKESMRIIKI